MPEHNFTRFWRLDGSWFSNADGVIPYDEQVLDHTHKKWMTLSHNWYLFASIQLWNHTKQDFHKIHPHDIQSAAF